MQAEFTIDVEEDPRGIVLRLAGEADARSSGEFERCTLALSAQQPKRIVIDAARLSFASSLALGLIMSLHHAISKSGGILSVASATPDVQDIFMRSRLDQRIPLVPTVEDGLSLPLIVVRPADSPSSQHLDSRTGRA